MGKIKSFLARISGPCEPAPCRHKGDQSHIPQGIEQVLRLAFIDQAESLPIPSDALQYIKKRIASERFGKVTSGKPVNWLNRAGLLPPNRRTTIIGTAVTIAAISLSVVLPMLDNQSPEVLAAEIAISSPQMQALLSDGELAGIELEEVAVLEEQALVVYEIDPEYLVVADIDLGTRQLVKLENFKLSDPVKQEIVGIASENILTGNLLENGGNITEFELTYVVNQAEVVQPDGKEDVKIDVSFLTVINISFKNQQFKAIIDFSNATVVNLFPVSD